MFRSELLNLNTDSLNVSGAKTPAFTDTSEFIDATDLEEVSGKKSGNWVLSFLKEHLALSIAAGVVLLLGILTLIALFFFYRKGKKVKNEMKTWMSDLQIYKNYGSKVYKAGMSNINDYILNFADKVVVLKNIYNKAESKLDDSSSMDSQEKESLQLMMLAAAKELKLISSGVISETKYNFFKTRIEALPLEECENIEDLWAKLRIDARAFFYDDMYCKFLTLSIFIELKAEQFMRSNNLQDLNNRVNESSARREILKNLDPLNLDEEEDKDGKNLIYEPRFPTIEDVPMSNIKLGWNAFFKFGNELSGFSKKSLDMLFLIRSRIIHLLSPTDSSRPVLDNKQLLVDLLGQCRLKSHFIINNDYLELSPKIEEHVSNYIADESNSLTYERFIEYYRQQTNDCESIDSQVEETIRYNMIDKILDQKSEGLKLSYNSTQLIDDSAFDSNLDTLLLNTELTERLNFDSDDCEVIKFLFAPTNNSVHARL